jgi:hypothetical protein
MNTGLERCSVFASVGDLTLSFSQIDIVVQNNKLRSFMFSLSHKRAVYHPG